MHPAALLLFALAAPPDPLYFGDRKQLCIDERFVAARERIELRVNPPAYLARPA